MAFAFVPILAQVLNLGIGDRSEVRYRVDVASDPRVDAWEAETRPYSSVELSWPKASIGADYTPSFIYAPLEDDPELTVLHAASARARLELRSRHTVVTFEERAEYFHENLSLQAVSPPRVDIMPSDMAPPSDMMPPGGGAPDAGTGGAASDGSVETRERASRGTLQVGRARSGIFVSQRISRKVTIDGGLGYGITGGLNDASREVYPVQYGPDADASLSYLASRRNTLITSAHGELVIARGGQRAFSAGADQGLRHRFNRRTEGDVRAGADYTRSESPNAPPSDQVYPTAGAGLRHERRLRGGILSLDVSIFMSPVVDQSTTTFDPRLSSDAELSYSRRRLTVFIGASGGISLAPDAPQALNSLSGRAGVAHRTTARLSLYSYAEGSFAGRPDGTQQLDSVTGGAGASYDLGAGFFAETGARGAFQRFESDEIVPATFAAFAALSWCVATRGECTSSNSSSSYAGGGGGGSGAGGASLASPGAKP